MPGESLLSLLTRLEQLNLYPPSTLFTLARALRPEASRPWRTDTYTRLATLTQRTPVDLYAATVNRWAFVLLPPGRTRHTVALPLAIPHISHNPHRSTPTAFWLGAASGPESATDPGSPAQETVELPTLRHGTLKAHTRPRQSAQYCPECLAEAPYHRLAWSSLLVTLCTRHARLLLTRCPGCSRAVNTRDVLAAQCATCEASLADAPPHPADDFIRNHPYALQAQLTVLDWLEAYAHQGRFPVSLPPLDTPCLQPETKEKDKEREGDTVAVPPSNAPVDGAGYPPGHDAALVASGGGGGRNDKRSSDSMPNLPPDVLYHVAYDLVGCLLYPNVRQERNRKVRRAQAAKAGLASALDGADTKDWKVSSTDPADLWEPLTRVVQALSDWPNGFYGLLDAYRQARGLSPHEPGTSLLDLGRLYRVCLQRQWKHPAFAPVQDAFNQYMLRRYVGSRLILRSSRLKRYPDLQDQFEYMSPWDAHTLLHCRHIGLRQLIASGAIRAVWKTRPDSNHQRVVAVSRADVMALVSQRRSPNLTQAARVLSISEEHVLKLVDAGLLHAIHDPRLHTSAGADAPASDEWEFDHKGVTSLLERVLRCVQGWPPPSAAPGEEPMTQLRALLALERCGSNYAGLIRLVLDGSLPAYYDPAQPARLRGLLFRKANITACQHAALETLGRLNRHQTLRHFGIQGRLLDKWIHLGLLRPVCVPDDPKGCYFERAELERFAREYVSGPEAAKMLAMRPPTLYNWVRRGWLTPVAGSTVAGSDPELDARCHGYLFLRCDIERRRPGNLVTAPKLAEMMGIPYARLRRYLREGRDTPVSGPGIDGRGRPWYEVPLTYAPDG